MMENVYTINIPVTPPQDDYLPGLSWHDSMVENKLAAYSSNNPLGVEDVVAWVVGLYYPVLFIAASFSNLFAIWVLRSHFLSHLVVQPMLAIYLHLHNLLLLVGPFYVWLVQSAGLGLSRTRVYPCFLLLWAHNFAMLATSGVLVAIVIERAVSIGKPEMLWKLWRKTCRTITCMLLVAAAMLAIAGLVVVEGALDQDSPHYPVCMPWWDNDNRMVSPVWFKILAINFSLMPALLLMLSMLFLLVSVARFSLLVRRGAETLNHYNALYMEIKATQHLKFVKSVLWLGLLFLVTCTPLGLFIVLGPAFLSLDKSQKAASAFSNFTTPSILLSKTINETAEQEMDSASDAVTWQPHRSLFEYSYLLLSRSNTETLLWSSYYSFSLFIVPVLLATEVLFQREWKGCIMKLTYILFCRKDQSPLWPSFDLFDTENQSGNLVGPYIARSDEYIGSNGLQKACKEAKYIKVYDATKAQLAGRKPEEELLNLNARKQVNQQVNEAKSSSCVHDLMADVNLAAEVRKLESAREDKSVAEGAALLRSLLISKVPLATASAVTGGPTKPGTGTTKK